MIWLSVPLKDVTMERVRVEEFEETNMKLSIFCGYKGYLYWSEKGMRRVSFSQTEWIGDLAS